MHSELLFFFFGLIDTHVHVHVYGKFQILNSILLSQSTRVDIMNVTHVNHRFAPPSLPHQLFRTCRNASLMK